jgi:hypothetical protein
MTMKRNHVFALSLTLAVAAFGTVIACGPAASPGPGCGDQPNMANALGELRQARAALDRSEHNKGGWRVAAIQQTDDAIRETQRGCAFANNH